MILNKKQIKAFTNGLERGFNKRYADLCGLSSTTMSDILHSNRHVSEELLVKMASARETIKHEQTEKKERLSVIISGTAA